jgi:hypothetical protein
MREMAGTVERRRSWFQVEVWDSALTLQACPCANLASTNASRVRKWWWWLLLGYKYLHARVHTRAHTSACTPTWVLHKFIPACVRVSNVRVHPTRIHIRSHIWVNRPFHMHTHTPYLYARTLYLLVEYSPPCWSVHIYCVFVFLLYVYARWLVPRRQQGVGMIDDHSSPDVRVFAHTHTHDTSER